MLLACFAVLLVSVRIFSGNDRWHKLDDNAVPNIYQFLLFPKGNVDIYDGLGGNIIGQLDRAVTASKKEILNKEVRVIVSQKEYGFMKLSDLSYLPVSEEKQMLDKWLESLSLQGYTQGKWEREKIGKDIWRISLFLIDSKHTRSEKYVFETDGVSVLRVRSIDSRSGVFEGALVFFGLILVIVYVAGRWLVGRIKLCRRGCN